MGNLPKAGPLEKAAGDNGLFFYRRWAARVMSGIDLLEGARPGQRAAIAELIANELQRYADDVAREDDF